MAAVEGWMREAGLDRRDAVRNLFGRYEGARTARRHSSSARTSTRSPTAAATTGRSAC